MSSEKPLGGGILRRYENGASRVQQHDAIGAGVADGPNGSDNKIGDSEGRVQ